MSLPIRARLTLWFTVLVFVGTGAVAALLYFGFQHSVDRFITEHLSHEAERVKRIMSSASSEADLRAEIDRVVGPQHYGYDFFCRVLDRDGAPIIESPAGEGLDFPLPATRSGNWTAPRLSTAPLPGRGRKGLAGSAPDATVRVYTAAIDPGFCRVLDNDAFLQIAQPTELMVERLHRFRTYGLISLAFVVTFFAIAGYFLTRKALQPVSEITEHASEIGASDLARRIPLRGTRDELDELASVLNGMFKRLDTAFVRNRRFAAAAAHQLRTPLTGLRGHLEMLSREPAFDGRLDDVLGDVDRMVTLCRRMLLWTKVAEGSGPSERAGWTEIELSELCHDLVIGNEKTADERGVRIVFEPGPDHYFVHGSATLLWEALHNLIENAIRHTPAGSQVDVLLRTADDMVHVVVRDNGPGIRPEDEAGLFRHFERGANSGTDGFGLGLPISRGIVRTHGGELILDRPSGGGTAFCVTLPLLARRSRTG